MICQHHVLYEIDMNCGAHFSNPPPAQYCSLLSMAYRALLSVCIYNIWRKRNLRRFKFIERNSNIVASLIVEDVIQCILSIILTSSASTHALYILWRITWPVEGNSTWFMIVVLYLFLFIKNYIYQKKKFVLN